MGGASAGWSVSAEGAPVFGNSSVADNPGPVATNDLGAYGAIAFGKRFDPCWDWRARLAWTGFRNARETDGLITVMSSLEYGTADVELGYLQPAPADRLLALRLFGGLRALYARDSADSSDKAGGHWQSQYNGAGPRLGADFERRIPDSHWGVSGMVAGAAIFGTRDAVDKHGDQTVSRETVLNLGGALGADYHVSDEATVTVGMRAEQWWNLRPGDRTNNIAIARDALSWGPFVKFEVKM